MQALLPPSMPADSACHQPHWTASADHLKATNDLSWCHDPFNPSLVPSMERDHRELLSLLAGACAAGEFGSLDEALRQLHGFGRKLEQHLNTQSAEMMPRIEQRISIFNGDFDQLVAAYRVTMDDIATSCFTVQRNTLHWILTLTELSAQERLCEAIHGSRTVQRPNISPSAWVEKFQSDMNTARNRLEDIFQFMSERIYPYYQLHARSMCSHLQPTTRV